jgi:hypothetical protein
MKKDQVGRRRRLSLIPRRTDFVLILKAGP